MDEIEIDNNQELFGCTSIEKKSALAGLDIGQYGGNMLFPDLNTV